MLCNSFDYEKKILNVEIRKEDLDTEEKILYYFGGYFSLYPVSVINTKLTFIQKFGIALSNSLPKRIGGISSYFSIKVKDKRCIKEKILDLVNNNNNKIAKEYTYSIQRNDGTEIEKSFIVICNNNMIENIHKNSLKSFHSTNVYPELLINIDYLYYPNMIIILKNSFMLFYIM